MWPTRMKKDIGWITATVQVRQETIKRFLRQSLKEKGRKDKKRRARKTKAWKSE